MRRGGAREQEPGTAVQMHGPAQRLPRPGSAPHPRHTSVGPAHTHLLHGHGGVRRGARAALARVPHRQHVPTQHPGVCGDTAWHTVLLWRVSGARTRRG
jgi:hypothetical protein